MNDAFSPLILSLCIAQLLLLVWVWRYFRRVQQRLMAENQDLQHLLTTSSTHSDLMTAELKTRVADKQAELSNSLQVLNCLYKTSQLIESYPQQTLSKVLSDIAQRVQLALSFPDSHVCLSLYGEKFETDNLITAIWCVHFPIRVMGTEIGYLQICQTEADRLSETDESMSCEICVQIGNLLARKKANEELYRLAHTDYLTRLPNRYAFNKLVDEHIRQWQQNCVSGQLLAIVFLDLDRFKNINDSMGHQHGDMLLKIIAERFKTLLKQADVVARLGGDEFIFMILAPSRIDLQATARCILDIIKVPCHVGGRDLSVSGSLGIAVYPQDGTEVDTLVQHADVAMYHAKQAGRNTFQFYRAQMNARTLELLALESDLRTALERQELLLYYQPQFSLHDGQLEGCEALLRWYAPGRGMVPPSEFIMLAEETGLIVPIGEWVLKTACQQLKQWHILGFDYLKMAINVSSLQFRESQFVTQASQILSKSELPMHAVELEITESSIIDDIKLAIEKLHKLRKLGFKVSIDDFGTGYSSLNYLKQFPVDKLKIDCSFVRDLAQGNHDEAIVKTIVMLGHNLNLNVLAEGVETQQQYELLQSYGTDAVQGFLTGKPQDAEQFQRLFLNADTAHQSSSLM